MKRVIAWSFLLVSGVASSGISALFERYPHVALPFSLAEKGHVLTTNFKAGGNLNKTYRYTFYLDFQVNDEDTHRISAILGREDPGNGAYRTDANGKFLYIKTGIRIPLRLTVSRTVEKTEVFVYSKEFDQLWSLGGSRTSIYKRLDQVTLEPALYHVRLETLDAVRELADVPVNFDIGLPGKH